MRIDRALREYSSEMHLSQAEICRNAGLDPVRGSGHLSMIFNNKVSQPSVSYLYLIVHRGLGVSLDEFLERAIELDDGRILSKEEEADTETG